MPPKEGKWFAPPKPVRWSSKALPVSWWSVNFVYILAGVVLLILGLEMPKWARDLHFASMLLFFALWLVKVSVEAVKRRRRRRDREFSDCAGLVEYPVEIAIVVDNHEIGADRGLVWFENDCLHFNGAATSFVLSARDIVRRQWLTLTDPYSDVPRDALLLRKPNIAYVRVRPLLGHGWRYRRRLKRFLKAAQATQTPRQWPPLRPYGELEPPSLAGLSPEEIGAQAARTGSATGVVRS